MKAKLENVGMLANMIAVEHTREALALLASGLSDEEIERRTGLELLQIIDLRAIRAVIPAAKRWPMTSSDEAERPGV